MKRRSIAIVRIVGISMGQLMDHILNFVQEKMYYDSVYMVSGTILSMGRKPLRVGDVLILPKSADDVQINHSCPEPCFALDVGTVALPWVLDEPLKDVVSPANEPPFLKKMWQRLLGKAQKDKTDS